MALIAAHLNAEVILVVSVALGIVQAGYSQTRMHLTYVALREVTWCMVVRCTQNLRRDGSSFMWHQPCQRCKYTPLRWIFKNAL